jgi:hypothetical protein
MSMKDRLLWLAILAVGLTALYCGIMRPQTSSIPSDLREEMADLKPTTMIPPIEPPALVIPPIPNLSITLPAFTPPVFRPVLRDDPIPGRPEVPIQPNATIDFSTGAPVVKTFGKDKEALEAAINEMAEAAKGARFEAKK